MAGFEHILLAYALWLDRAISWRRGGRWATGGAILRRQPEDRRLSQIGPGQQGPRCEPGSMPLRVAVSPSFSRPQAFAGRHFARNAWALGTSAAILTSEAAGGAYARHQAGLPLDAGRPPTFATTAARGRTTCGSLDRGASDPLWLEQGGLPPTSRSMADLNGSRMYTSAGPDEIDEEHG